MVQERTRKWEYNQKDEDQVVKSPGWRATHGAIYAAGVGLGPSGKPSVGTDGVWRSGRTPSTTGTHSRRAVVTRGRDILRCAREKAETTLGASMASRRDSVSLLETGQRELA